jgi:5'-nucleotidase
MRPIATLQLTGARLVALIVAATLLATSVMLGLQATQAEAKKPDRTPVTIQFLNISDWHGQLDPVNGVGGAAVLSAYFQQDRAQNPNTLTLTAGDAYGATPPLSNFFQEIPAVHAMRMMGFDVDTFGNHNFDRGLEHLKEMVGIVTAPAGGDIPGEPFQYVAANLSNRDANDLSDVPSWQIFEVGGIKVGVVGLVNEEAPTLVFPGSFGTMQVTDAVVAATKARVEMKRAGAQILVAITHKGVRGFDEEGNAFGELIDFANNVGGYDLIFGDHTDIEYKGVHGKAIVSENRSKGIRYSRTTIEVDSLSGRVINRTAGAVEFITPVAANVTPDPEIQAMLQPFREELSALLDGTIGVATDTFVRGGNIERRQEVALGDLIADGMRWRYDTQLGFMNAGGIRTPLPNPGYAPADTSLRRPTAGYAAGPPWDLVVGDVYSVMPFGNIVTTRTVTGAQLWAALENGVSKIAADGTGADGRFPQISGFRFTFHYTNPTGCSGNENPSLGPLTWTCVPSRVTSVELDDGTPILPDSTTYTIALPNFTNSGGDSYFVFADGQGVTREVDADVMLAYIQEIGPTLTPMTDGRIDKQP